MLKDIIERKCGDEELRKTEVRPHPELPLNKDNNACMHRFESVLVPHLHADSTLCLSPVAGYDTIPLPR